MFERCVMGFSEILGYETTPDFRPISVSEEPLLTVFNISRSVWEKRLILIEDQTTEGENVSSGADTSETAFRVTLGQSSPCEVVVPGTVWFLSLSIGASRPACLDFTFPKRARIGLGGC